MLARVFQLHTLTLGFILSLFSKSLLADPIGTVFTSAIYPTDLHLGAPEQELFYQVSYHLTCGEPQENQFRGDIGFFGKILLQGRPKKVIRFDLLQGKHSTLVSLGRPSSDLRGAKVVITSAPQTHCTLLAPIVGTLLTSEQLIRKSQPLEVERCQSSSAEVGDNNPSHLYALALKNSPYLRVRNNQLGNRTTDLPLELTYSFINRENKAQESEPLIIRYTFFFSDEDSKSTSIEVDHQMSRYGRGTDVEWIYEVALNSVTGERLTSSLQGDFASKFKNFNPLSWQWSGDHSNLKFEGEFWPDTSHPIIYNIADNNVFSDKAIDLSRDSTSYIAYHPALLRQNEVAHPFARERFQISEHGTYMYGVSDLELKLENKLPAYASDYLYFIIRGDMAPMTFFNINNGAFKISLEISHSSGSQKTERFSSSFSVDRFGEDLYQKESVPAIQLNQHFLDLLESEKLNVKLTFQDVRKLGRTRLQDAQLYSVFRLKWNHLLGRYERVDMTIFKNYLNQTIRLQTGYI